jgi:2-C-methyl-D-erythritol 4-phosphate cytidylyltransferase
VNIAIVLAGGRSVRFGGSVPKVIAPLGGKPVLQWSLDVFGHHPWVEAVVLVVSPESRGEIEGSVDWNFRLVVAEGGEDRRQSVFNGLLCAQEHFDSPRTVLVHDGARPFISVSAVDRLCAVADRYSAATLACPSPDTLVEASEVSMVGEGLHEVARFVDRSRAYCVQTPQIFRFDKLYEAHLLYRSILPPPPVYDDCGIFHLAFPADPIALVPGDPTNIKITYPSDLRA